MLGRARLSQQSVSPRAAPTNKAISDVPRLEKATEEGRLSLARFIFVTRRVTAIEILRGVQRVLEREIFVLYHSTQKLQQRANLGWILSA